MRIGGYHLHKCRYNYVYDIRYIYAYDIQKCIVDMEMCFGCISPRLNDLCCRFPPIFLYYT